MGFNSVYQTLKELFPQVDARILKAVAIEHSKDPDAAVESIFTEVLPFVNDQSHFPTSDVKNNGKAVKTRSQSSAMLRSIVVNNTAATDPLNISHNMNSWCFNETLDDSLTSSFYDAKDSDDHLSGNSKNEELVALENFVDASGHASQRTPDILIGDISKDVCNQEFENHENESCFPSHQYQDARVDLHENNNFPSSANVKNGEADVQLSNGWNMHPNCNGLPSHDVNASPSADCQKEQSFQDCNSLECQEAIEETLVLIKDNMLDALDLNLPEPENDMLLCGDENQQTSSNVDAELVQESVVGAEDEIVSNTIVTRSGYICSINLVEDLIENAKGHKDTMSSTMELVKGLIKDVEYHEKAAQQAKEDVTRGGLKILEKVEEIKKILKHAKEANDMDAGEVYGEKSILATEVKELQTRLLGLSDEKEKSLSVLDEMQRALEERLILAEADRKKAEQEMFEKEEIARSALAEQELIMEKVVQESKLLQQEAEENAKLRDFLIEKGRVVDILQGEISLICQDVKLLKDNFDESISAGKSPLSRQASSSLLASSNSSVKSMASADSAPGKLELFESHKRTSSTSSVGCQTPRSSAGEEEALKAGATTPRKEILDEDWELFDF